MNDSDKSYFEIKVSFVHILTLIAAVILISIILFYLGYRAGKASQSDMMVQNDKSSVQAKDDPVNIIRDDTPATTEKGKSNIKEEMKKFEEPTKQTKALTPAQEVVKETYYSVQVGSFASFNSAKNYANKFIKLGYESEILSADVGGQRRFRVWVGHYRTRAEALATKVKLENLEKQKFLVKRSGGN